MTYNYSGMSKFSNILVTGGAGYIGSVLTRKLVESKYNVKVLDSLIFGQDGITDLVSNKSVKLFPDDIRNKKIITNGGRVLGVTALGNTLELAIKNAYDVSEKIFWENKYSRTDIGKKGLTYL